MLTRLAVINILVVYCFIELASSCSCRRGTPLSKRFNEATYVFIGKAIHSKFEHTSSSLKVLFQVEEVFKGSISVDQTIHIHTNMQSAACGVFIRTGERWQIWAYGSEERLRTNICSPTTKHVDRNIDFLRQLASSVSCTRKSIKVLILTLLFSSLTFLSL